jgi:hypothetical protein
MSFININILIVLAPKLSLRIPKRSLPTLNSLLTNTSKARIARNSLTTSTI